MSAPPLLFLCGCLGCVEKVFRFWQVQVSFLCSLPYVGCVTLGDCFSNNQAKPSMQNEETIMRLCTDIPFGTLSIHCVTCRGPNNLSAVSRIWFSPLRSTAVFATFGMFYSYSDEAFTRGGTTFCSTPRLLRTGTPQCHLHNRFCCLRHILYPSDVANSAPTRIIWFSENPQPCG